jgi:acetolactate synthase-1/2/3 large subunit
VHGIPDSFARAYSIMMTEPQGPAYMAYDAGIQEAELTEEIKIPSTSAIKVPPRLAADPELIGEAADMLLAADYPVLLTEYAARAPIGFDDTVELAETIGSPVFDINKRLGFPNRHPLNVSMHADAFKGADLVMALDVIDWTRGSHKPNWETREVEAITTPDCKWIDVGFADIEISKWATDYNKHHNWDMRILADTANAIPALSAACKTRIDGDTKLITKIKDRAQAVGEKHTAQWDKWQEQVKDTWDQMPMHEARMAHEVYDAIKGEDWVLTAGTLKDWVRKVWNFDKPYQHPGRDLGTGTQFGISLGVAYAYKDTDKVVVDLQPDGDLMFDLGALWVAAKYEIPILVIMYNNRAYYNDWAHQISVAKKRGTDQDRAYIGMDLEGPAPDFAHIAKGIDWYAEGPIFDPAEIGPAVARGIEQVKKGKPALIDVITWRRGEAA